MENQVELYQSQDGINLTIQFANETVWLSQEQLALLFERDQSVISKHIKNVFIEGELDRESNMQKMHIANSDKPVALYNLEVVISLGYRVKSIRGTQFRQWATKRLTDYCIITISSAIFFLSLAYNHYIRHYHQYLVVYFPTSRAFQTIYFTLLPI